MLVPFSWLKEYVDIDITPQELEKKLFDCGFEVEELREVGADIKNVVVGLVETCEAIPDTHLHLTAGPGGRPGRDDRQGPQDGRGSDDHQERKAARL